MLTDIKIDPSIRLLILEKVAYFLGGHRHNTLTKEVDRLNRMYFEYFSNVLSELVYGRVFIHAEPKSGQYLL